jgi:hypothetical protein
MKQLQVLLVCLALVSLLACGGGKKTVTISINPITATVFTTQNQQFVAIVNNASSSAVTWDVNGVVGGNSVYGTVNATGLYTAPVSLPTPATVVVTVTSVVDTTKQASASITLMQGANPAITPSSLTLQAGAQQTFSVTTNGVSASSVTYSLSCKSTAPAGCGSITTDGVFTAPSTPPPGGNVIITAAVNISGAEFDTSATATIVGSAGNAGGQYAFSLSGSSNGNSYHAAGSIVLDGNGNVTGGSEDVNEQGAVSSVTFTGGTYTYSTSDGRIAANVQTSSGNMTFYMVLANASRGYIEYAGSGISASGTMALQDATKFSASSVNGPYAFRLSGLSAGTSQSLGEAGAFTADGTASITSGLLDANSGGTVTNGASVTGTFTAPTAPTGRGTMTLTSSFGTQSFAYYLVDATQFKLVETDATQAVSGDAVQQTGGPYTNASFNGTIAMVLNGAASATTFGLGGTIPISNGSVLGGNLDRNNSGVFTAGQTVSGGTFTVDATTGRTPVTVNLSGGGTVSLVLYPQSDSAFYVLDESTGESGTGVAYSTSGATLSTATLNGKYALALTGTVGSTPEDVVGSLNSNGGGAITGTVDITNSGANTALQSSPYTITASSATMTLKSSFANFNSVGFNLYIVDATRSLLLENDTKGVLTGLIDLQQ